MATGEPRDVAALLEHLRAVGPPVRCSIGELAQAFDAITAAIMAEAEAAVFTLHQRTFILEADGDHLEEHGRERAIFRFTEELDADYAQRVAGLEDKVTKPAILAHVDALLAVGTARMEEWLPDGAFTDILGLQGFTETSHTHGGDRGFTVYISEQFDPTSDRGYALAEPAVPFEAPEDVFHTFAGTDAQADVSAFAEGVEPVPGDIYPRTWAEIERLRAGGLGPPPHFRVEIE